MRVPYCTDIRDEQTGVTLAYDFECELEIEIERDNSIRIDGIYKDGVSLLRGDTLTRSIAATVCNLAEADKAWSKRVVLDHVVFA